MLESLQITVPILLEGMGSIFLVIGAIVAFTMLINRATTSKN